MAEWICRGKSLDTREWVEGHLLSFADGQINPNRSFILPTVGGVGFVDGRFGFTGFIEVDPSTVGRYIGALDVRGRKVFEGDRVRLYHIPQHCVYGEYAAGVICWDDEQMRFALKMEDGQFYSLRSWACYTVDGNLWDDRREA